MATAILLQPVEALGERGDVIDVAPGYLRNFLIPRKLAQPATEASVAEARRRMEAEERAAREAEARAGENAALLTKTVLTIPAKAGEDGRLFGSVTEKDVADAIEQARGIKVDRRKVKLAEPIRTTGSHMVTVELPGGATADVKTIVTAE
jgi:large subunit ribosomal protein L9